MARAGTALVPHWKCVQPEEEQLDRGLVRREVVRDLVIFPQLEAMDSIV